MPLDDKDRRPNGSPAVVPTLKQFQTHFQLFSEGSLLGLDWDNVVAVGSSVATSLLPLPAEYAHCKRKIRHFYHEQFAPASDVDLFLYGLNEQEAIQKIRHIEQCINDSMLTETSTIVLRLYKSIAEIFTGLDVDCSAVAYDGNQVYLAPRALSAAVSRNTLAEVSKYFIPELDRSRIDPTIFDRNLKRLVGLARLLVLEKLPRTSERERYQRQRMQDRGRPSPPSTRRTPLPGNIKDEWDDEVPDWLEEDEVSNYHTLKLPYGKRYDARKIEKLLFTKDLLLNAEWNRQADREVDLHRHPASFGTADDVIQDCCGYCPSAATSEEKAVSEEESKLFISGQISFLADNPGRQEIGSFHPITEGEWTDMAYIGNTEGLCQAIVDANLESVESWIRKGTDINRRDHTGRTPLHLAVMSSTTTIVQYLVDQGARITWRLADGRSALHLAAARGDVDIVRVFLTKSEHNEEEETRKQAETDPATNENSDEESDALASNLSESSSDLETSYATGSFVNVEGNSNGLERDLVDANTTEPDVYDINAVAWDSHASPLHLAILNGHVEVVEELVSSFGADVLRPAQLTNQSGTVRAVSLTLVLACQLPLEQAKSMTAKLLQLGASPAQVDIDGRTPLYYVAARGHEGILDIYLQYDRPAVARAINHLSATQQYESELYIQSPLMAAIMMKAPGLAKRLLKEGAHPSVSFEDYIKAAERFSWTRRKGITTNRTYFEQKFDQPVILAVEHDMPSVCLELLAHGADPNTLPREALSALRAYRGEKLLKEPPPERFNPDDDAYMQGLSPGTYRYWRFKGLVAGERAKRDRLWEDYNEMLQSLAGIEGLPEKKSTIQKFEDGFRKLELDLVSRGAKALHEMYMDVQGPSPQLHENHASSTRGVTAFQPSVNFQRLDNRGDYLKLFEAAWIGDISVITRLTTTVSADRTEPPLEIGVTDDRGYSAFALAVIQGHLGVAEAILAICVAQYKPDEEPEACYHIQQAEYSDDDASDEDEDSGLMPLQKVTVDPPYTVETVGEIKTEVESKIQPLVLLNQKYTFEVVDPYNGTKVSVHNLINYALLKDDIDLLKFLLKLGQQLTQRYSKEDYAIYEAGESHLLLAMRLGRLRCLEVLAKQTGAGLPLDDLVASNTVPVENSPGYYRGLSVRGKRREDWATRGRGTVQSTNATTFLSEAISRGTLEVAQWFFSHASTQCYNEFISANSQEARIKRLSLAAKGLHTIIEDFLQFQGDHSLYRVALPIELTAAGH
ncbi:hypothetical protein BJY04DRAFT_221473 [Aspergillus karnatakaensis]|uniref:ankyrin repeat domain-containing protein n=1 Tax=Aspergillus karnatakaensis TaxID=1810916 RepID=UPI003CCE084D